MFNIPITDIFMKKTFKQALADLEGFGEDEYLSLKNMNWEVSGTIPFADDTNMML
jgi:hypothetical protein